MTIEPDVFEKKYEIVIGHEAFVLQEVLDKTIVE